MGCYVRGLGLGCDASCRRWGYPTPTEVKNHRNPRTCGKRRLRGGWEPSPQYSIPPRCHIRKRGEGRVKPPQSLNFGVFNVRGCSTNEVKKGEIGKRFLRRGFMCMLS